NKHVSKQQSQSIEHLHYSLIIDVAGESDQNVPRGQILNLSAVNVQDKTVQFTTGHLSSIIKSPSDYIPLGKITNNLNYHPRQWAYQLSDDVQDYWYPEFVASKGSTWSHQSNCQQFARFLVTKLKLVWPPDIPVAGDGNQIEPIIVDPA
ncbi:hypothetical protein SAMD00019534_070170, partial [Acytostelium subglobosum LB1]|uniref:hypothetical protein n=1 Tax=Acytostelium subglobosum LB1 TaxID=1410327 RepID=UPI000644E9C5